MNSPLGALTKFLTLLPFVVLVYFFDLRALPSALSAPEARAVFAMAGTFFILWVVLKRHVLAASLEVSSASFAWGALLIAGSVLSYLYGSFTSEATWFHYESLIFFIAGYVALRIGTRILRALAPALMMLGIGFLPLYLLPGLEQDVMVLVVGLIMIAPLLSLIEPRPGMAVLAFSVWYLGLVAWRWPVFYVGGSPVQTWVLTPVPLIALVVPATRRRITLRSKDSYSCGIHKLDGSGFCSFCGRKSGRGTGNDKFEGWGLVAIGVVTALLLFSSVPVLAAQGGIVYDATYTARGLTTSATPTTPTGWQVNSSTRYPTSAVDLYAVRVVYVPLVRPEVKNYTEYFVISTGSVVPGAPEGDIPGWSRSAYQPLSLGQLQGYLTSYTQPGVVMVSYEGKSSVAVLTGAGFQTYYVFVGYVREFRNSNVAADSQAFLADVQGIWIPMLATDFLDSSWGAFVSSTLATLAFVTPFVEMTLSLTILGWVAYKAMLYERRLDRFITVSSLLDPVKWVTLSSILLHRSHSGTEHELTGEVGTAETSIQKSMHENLNALERRNLVERTVEERGGRLVGVWKVTV